MSGHTPGPWEVRHFNGVGVFAVNNPAGNDATTYPIVDFGHIGGTRLAEFTRYGTPEANARLIAAAPDLLEALRWYVDGAANGRSYEEWIEGRERAVAAIAAATGEPA